MKNLLHHFRTLLLCLIFLPVIAGLYIVSGCKTPPARRVITVQTLEAVGTAAKGAMDGATQLLKSGQITVSQWQTVATIYDNKFQPAYALSVSAVNADLSSIASPDLAALAQQLVQTVATFIQKPSTL